MRKGIVNNEISYDFSERMFLFVHSSNNNVSQYYYLSQEDKDRISKISKPKIQKISVGNYSILMI